VSFSAGVVEHDCLESLDEALQRADAATYAAKRAGKNRIVPGERAESPKRDGAREKRRT
jgi:PleD family two-component response regulator